MSSSMEDGSVAFEPSASAPLRPSLFRPSTDRFSASTSSSALFRSLSNLSLFKRSCEHWSRDLTLVSSIDHAASENPLLVLKSLLDLLLESNVRGPTLVRLQSEFSHVLGRGGTFEVFGISKDFDINLSTILHFCGAPGVHPSLPSVLLKSEPDLRRLKGIAVKRAYIYQTRQASASRQLSTETSTRAFGQQISCAYREIEALCFPAFRHHPNIVKLLGWGLCLDSLEEPSPQNPVIPLLLLERAHFSLSAYIKHEAKSKFIDYSQYASICLGIGAALRVIHSAGYVHGDLKLENVLLFCDKTRPAEERRWTAKICDFGLATTENSHELYKGTPGWTPVKSGSRYNCGVLQSCDIFGYGLIVWFLFTGRWHSPIPLDDCERVDPEVKFSDQRIYFTAASEVRSSRRILREKNRILAVLRGSLHYDARFWETQPWIYFDPVKYHSMGDVIETPTLLMRLFALVKQLRIKPGVWTGLIGEFKTLIYAFCVVSVFLLYHMKQWFIRIGWSCRSMMHSCAYVIPSRIYTHSPESGDGSTHRKRILLNEAERLGRSLSRRVDPDGLDLIQHGSAPCFDLSDLGRLSNLVDRGLGSYLEEDEIYALARLRSRFQACCWRKYVATTSQPNVLESALHHYFAEKIFAWLCRGPIGENEVRNLNVAGVWDWVSGGVYTSGSLPHSQEETSGRYKLGAQVLLRRLCLLIQHELRVDLKVFDKGSNKTLCRLIMDNSLMFPSTQGYSFVSTICKSLLHLSRRDHLPNPLRFFLTGRGLPDQIGDNETSGDYSTTFLHESVLASSYEAVEQILLSDFNFNALNDKGETAARIAYNELRYHQSLRVQGANAVQELQNAVQDPRALDMERIFYLLKQNGSIELDSGLSYPTLVNCIDGSGQTWTEPLPPGWELMEHRSNVPHFFREIHTGSITCISPKFSLFSDQRLALGFRKVSSMSGQVYHLDLHRFLETPKKLDRDATNDSLQPFRYTKEWYKNDIDLTNGVRKLPLSGAVQEDTPLLRRPLHRPAFRSRIHLLSKSFWRHLNRIVLDSRLNTFAFFIPFSIVADILRWSPGLRIGFSLPSLLILSHRVRVAISAQAMIFRHTTTPPYEDPWTASITSLSLGSFAILQHQYLVVLRLLIGNILMSTLMAPGSLFFIHGFNVAQGYLQEYRMNLTTGLMLIGMSFPAGICATTAMTSASSTVSGHLSHGIAIFALLAFFICLFTTSERLEFVGPEIPLEIYGFTGNTSNYHYRDAWPELLTGVLSIALTALCSKSLVSGISELQLTIWINLFVVVGIPVVQQLADNGRAFRDSMNGQIDRNTFSKTCSALFALYLLAPTLVVVSWIARGSFVFYFSLIELIYTLSGIFVLYLVTRNGNFNYRGGLVLCFTYLGLLGGLIVYWGNK